MTQWNDSVLAQQKEVPFSQVTIDANPQSKPWYKMVGDINGNGVADIVVRGSKGPLLAYVAPDWKKTQIADGGWDGVNGEIADLDGDGDLDIIGANHDGAHPLKLWRNERAAKPSDQNTTFSNHLK